MRALLRHDGALCERSAHALPSPPLRLAPVAQLDRVLPSEGRGHRFESCRVRQYPTPRAQVVTCPRGLRASARRVARHPCNRPGMETNRAVRRFVARRERRSHNHQGRSMRRRMALHLTSRDPDLSLSRLFVTLAFVPERRSFLLEIPHSPAGILTELPSEDAARAHSPCACHKLCPHARIAAPHINKVWVDRRTQPGQKILRLELRRRWVGTNARNARHLGKTPPANKLS